MEVEIPIGARQIPRQGNPLSEGTSGRESTQIQICEGAGSLLTNLQGEALTKAKAQRTIRKLFEKAKVLSQEEAELVAFFCH